MGLDVMRAMKWNSYSIDALLEEIKLGEGANRYLDAYTLKLENELAKHKDDFEPHARRMLSIMAKALQGSLLIRQSINEVGEVFCASRLGGEWAHEFGTLKVTGKPLKKIIDRATLKCMG